MKWVTREKAKVDRIACPWLIKNFIDEEAEFIFAPHEQVLSVAKTENAISFDAPGAKFNHSSDGKCTFEVLVDHYRIKDKAIQNLAKVVHGADVPEDIQIVPESAGLRAIADGFRLISRDDHENMRKQFAVYDALYGYFKKEDR
ncbi:Chromate resistance exported protein [uncultured archaeon]|nr:Chromate resistance exported protein [uncultured archaeon]